MSHFIGLTYVVAARCGYISAPVNAHSDTDFASLALFVECRSLLQHWRWRDRARSAIGGSAL